MRNNLNSEENNESNNVSPNESTTNTNNSNAEQNLSTSINNLNSTSHLSDIRDPNSNQIEQLSFDINYPQFTNNFLDRVARNMFQSLLNPNTQNNNDRVMVDPSNNIIFYETILRPNNNNH